MEFAELIRNFAAKYQLEGLEVTDNLAAGLQIDGHNLVIMHDAERSQVLLIGQIGTAPEQGRQLLAETLLKANYLFIGTNGATLCLNPSTDSYELLLPVKLKDLTVDEFSAHFERMIENLHTWWVMLDNYAENEARKGSSSDQGEGFDRSNNISGDLMRV